jgi:hypothetical protein
VKQTIYNTDVYAVVRAAGCRFSSGGSDSPLAYLIGAVVCAVVLVVVSYIA